MTILSKEGSGGAPSGIDPDISFFFSILSNQTQSELEMATSKDPRVPVYILTGNADGNDLARLMASFGDNYFMRIPTSVKPVPGHTRNQTEHRRIYTCLKDAYENHNGKSCIIVKDDSLTFTSPEDLAELIRSVEEDSGWHLFYLSSWLDRCDLRTERRTFKGSKGKRIGLAKAKAPQGLQAIMFSPTGRDIMLGKSKCNDGQVLDISSDRNLSEDITTAISQGKMTAMVAEGGVFKPDPTRVDDFAKFNDCAPTTGTRSGAGSTRTATVTVNPTTPAVPAPGVVGGPSGTAGVVVKPAPTNNGMSNTTWFIIILGLVLLLLLAYWYFRKRNESVVVIE